MPTKRAKIIAPEDRERVFQATKHNKFPERDLVILMLSHFAGLRAQEISGLDWEDVTDGSGTIGVRNEHGHLDILIPSDIAKRGKYRTVPLHPRLRNALKRLRKKNPDATRVIHGSHSNKPFMSPNAVAQHLGRAYKDADLVGCASHSGRRTFITSLGRDVNNHGCSLRDVQKLAGHASLTTTEAYLAPSERVSKLVGNL